MKNLTYIISKEIEDTYKNKKLDAYVSGFIDGMAHVRDVIIESYNYYEQQCAIESLYSAGYFNESQRELAYSLLESGKL